jgi:hypothetical protein
MPITESCCHGNRPPPEPTRLHPPDLDKTTRTALVAVRKSLSGLVGTARFDRAEAGEGGATRAAVQRHRAAGGRAQAVRCRGMRERGAPATRDPLNPMGEKGLWRRRETAADSGTSQVLTGAEAKLQQHDKQEAIRLPWKTTGYSRPPMGLASVDNNVDRLMRPRRMAPNTGLPPTLARIRFLEAAPRPTV